MAAAYRAKATVSSTVSAASVPMTLDASTVAGDTAVVFLCRSSTTTVSGLGATWTKVASNGSFVDGPVEVWVGLGCTSGQTVITMSFSPNGGCDAVALVGGGVPALLSSAISLVTSTTPAAPAQTSTSSAGDQMVMDFFLIDGNPTVSSFTDSPGAFTTETNVGSGTWNTIRKVSAYRIPAETSAEARTANIVSSPAATASVLLGQTPPTPSAVPYVLAARGFF